MAKYIITSPDGQKYEVAGEGSEEEALDALKQHLGSPDSSATTSPGQGSGKDYGKIKRNIQRMIDQNAPESDIDAYVASEGTTPEELRATPKGYGSPQWSELPGNILPSAGKMAGDMWQAVSNPGDTAQGVVSAITGANLNAENAVSEYLPSWAGPVANAANYFNPITGPMMTAAKLNPAFAQQSEATADTIGSAMQDRYGGLDKIKNTMVTDPVGFAADASTILSGGAGLTARTPMLSRGLKMAAKATDPLAMGGKALQKAGEAVGTAASYPLSVMTGASPDAIRMGYKSGKGGGETATAFRDNMRGHEAPETVVNEARGALDNMADTRRADYIKNMQSTLSSGLQVDPTPIYSALDDLRQSFTVKSNTVPGANANSYAPLSKASPDELASLDEIENLLGQWVAHPEGLTPAGLDALKQRLNKMQPSFTAQNAGNLRRIVTTAENAVKSAIVKVVPGYEKAMNDYSKSKQGTDAIAEALKLGKRPSVDATAQRLKSAVGSNRKARTDALKTLEANGAPNLMPRLAGQQLSEWMPQGLLGKAISTALSGAAYFNPFSLAGVPFSSPRLVGELAHGMGRGARRIGNINSKAGLLTALLGRTSEEQNHEQR